MDWTLLTVREAGRALIVGLNDPAAMNAVSAEMLTELDRAIDLAAREYRALVITGEGKSFCSGANLSRLRGRLANEGDAYDPGALLESHVNPILRKLRGLPIPWISAVNGAAVGVGCAFALSADMIIAGESAFFMFAFQRAGLAPDGGSSFLLSRAVGRVRAMKLLMLGERLPAATALDWGLVTQTVPDDSLQNTASELARKLANGPTCSFAIARKAVWAGLESGYEEALDQERVLQRQAGQTSDHREGVKAFLEKRAPNFTGE